MYGHVHVGITTNDVYTCICVYVLLYHRYAGYETMYTVHAYIQCSVRKSSFSVFLTFSQSWYMLLRHRTYQHDPQGLLINLISMITHHVIVT